MIETDEKAIYITELRRLILKCFRENTSPSIIEGELTHLINLYEDGEKSDKPYVCLQSLTDYNSFWSKNIPNEDPRTLSNGIIAYRILGYYDTPEECKKALGYILLEDK